MSGLWNLVTFGVATTQALQGLRGVDRARFNAWYEPIEANMREDPLLKYFWNLRSQIVKKGTAGTIKTTFTIAGSFNVDELLANPPPGAHNFVMGDEVGASYWEVPQRDGSTAKYYVQLPESMKASTSLHFENPPTEHLGQPLSDTSIETLARLYIAYIRDVVQKATGEFMPRSSSTRPNASS
jgi:hypothetical protein